MFDYYYGKESESFSFIRIPKMLFTDDLFKGLSVEAKFLYGLLLDRMSLSRTYDWFDEEGRVYIIYTISEITADLCCSENKAIKVLAELDSKKGVGLVEKKRRGLGKADLIYVKNFTSHTDDPTEPLAGKDNVYQKDGSGTEDNAVQEPQNEDFRNCKSFNSRTADSEVLKPQDLRSNNTKYNNTDSNNTDLFSLHPALELPSAGSEMCFGEIDGMDEEMFVFPDPSEVYPDLIKRNVALDKVLARADPRESDIAEKLYGIMCEMVTGDGEGMVRIHGRSISRRTVISRFLKLEYRHFNYAIRQICAQQREIRAFKPYALTVLYRSFDVPDVELDNCSGHTDPPVNDRSRKKGGLKSVSFDGDPGQKEAYVSAWKKAACDRDWDMIGKLLVVEQFSGFAGDKPEPDNVKEFPGEKTGDDNVKEFPGEKTEEGTSLRAACV